MGLKLKKLIGRGFDRDVYEHPDNPDWVVKVSKKLNRGINTNEMEWEVWNTVKDTEYAKYFAPCIELTKEGHLVMIRCSKPEKSNEERMYANGCYIRDSKRKGNKGILNGEMVVIDYGHPHNRNFLNELKEHG